MDKRILVVDDDEEVSALVAATLEQAGYTAVEAGSAVRALKMLAAEPFPVVVSDIMMPDMDGLQLLRKIKEIDESVRVIMMTAHATVDAAIEALNGGATNFLKKPFDASELIAKVNGAFEKFRKEDEVRKLIDDLRCAKEYDEQIIQNLVYTVIVLDPQGNIKKLNKAMESLLGYREEEVTGHSVSMIFSEAFRKTKWDELIKEKKVINFPVTFVTKRRKEIPATFTGTVMKSFEGAIVGFIGTTRNLSETPE